jgi:chlorophyllide a reductase subunit Y
MKMKQGLPFVEGAPVGIDGTYRWILSLAEPLKLDPAIVARVAAEERDRVAAAISGHRLDGLNVMVAGYEGHEFLLVRLLIEAGANVPYLSTAVSSNPLAREEEAWLGEHGCKVLYGANFEDEIAALTDRPYDCVIGTTPLCAHAKELGIPAIYYTNAIATRSMMFADGAADVLALVTQTVAAKGRYDRIARFFAEDETALERTYTSWAPKIDLTEHLIANQAI